MAQLLILAISLSLLWLTARSVLRRSQSRPFVGQAEALTREQRCDHLRVLAQDTPPGRPCRLHWNGHVLHMLRRLSQDDSAMTALDYLRSNVRGFLMPLMALRDEVRRSPALHGDQTGVPRLLQFFRRYLQWGGTAEAADLLAAVQALDEGCGLALMERRHVPVCLRLCLAEQLEQALSAMDASLKEYQRGERLARRLRRSRKPMALLEGQQLSLSSAQAMLTHLHAWQETALLVALEERMAQDHFSPELLSEQFASQQTRLTDSLAQVLQAYRTLDQIDWPRLSEKDDPLHRLLMSDPSGIYPRMDFDSRALYRLRAAGLARRFAVHEQSLMHSALELCSVADPDSLHDHVGWYLLEYDGMRALHRHLHARHGLLYLFVQRHASWLYRISLALCALAAGLVFLHSRHPLSMLPVFLGVFSCLSHALGQRIIRRLKSRRPLPRMQVDKVTEELRTLVVIPAVLHDRSQAVPMVRRLLLARKAFPEGAVDCLLLCDYGDSITQTSSEDPAIVSAARMAVEAIDGDGGRMLYLQRSRVWDGDQRAYIGRERRRGALEAINQLIVHGQCADAFDAHTVPLSYFHRRYTYVLALDADTLPGPDTLLPLIGALSHPLNERRHTAEGLRGVSILRPQPEIDPDAVHSRIALWESSGTPAGHTTGLYRPDALLEAVEGWILPDTVLIPDQLEDGLAGCMQDTSAFFTALPSTVTGWCRRAHRRTRGDWLLSRWLFPYVRTPGGVRRNPLSSHSKYMLRQNLRRSLVPLCQLLLLLYALLARSLPLGLFALLAPELPLASPQRFLARLVELPLRAVIRADAICRTLWQMLFTHRGRMDWLPSVRVDTGADLSVWENWSESLAAIGFAAFSLTFGPVSLPGLTLACTFAAFPLMHPFLDGPLRSTPRPTADMATSLMDAAEATWQFFEETVAANSHFLPPHSLQIKPWRGTAQHTTPADIGMYLLSCLAARELGIITTDEMCLRAARTMDALDQLPLWHGLPFSRYDTATLAPMEPPFIASTECGVLCACLITLAQGLRSFLPEMADEHHSLSARADAFAQSMELHRLYDHDAQLFAIGYDLQADALSSDHHDLYASEARLLSFVAVMRRDVPLRHFAHLNRTQVRTGSGSVCVSRSGSAGEYLMPLLLLPVSPHTMMESTLHALIRAQKKCGVEGMFGISESGWWGFDSRMNYQTRTFGLPEAALGPCAHHPVIAPYATALCLPFALHDAFDSLMRMRSRGMQARLGYFESIDFDPAHLPDGSDSAVVQTHMAHHQGMLLCAMCNALTGSILVRHFTAVPEAASAAILLKEKKPPALTLPARVLHPENIAPKEPPFRRSAQALLAPVDAHLIGSPEAMLLMSAQGLGVMRSRGVTLTRFTSDPTQLEGVQFYLQDGPTTYRLGDPGLPGETIFTEGAVRLSRHCGALRCTLTALTDPVQGAFLHVVEVANLTDRERTFDLADCLVPELSTGCSDQSAHADLFIQTGRPEERGLTITRRPVNAGEPPLTLCHAISTHEPLLALAAQTDRTAFQGRSCTLHAPLSLRQPLQEGLIGAPVTPCASFRARLRVGPRGKSSIIFVTRLMRPGESFSLEALAPRLSDAGNMLDLSRLLSRTITDSLSIDQHRASELSLLFGPLMWRCQPHQGALTPLRQSLSSLRALGLDPHQPILTLMLHSEGCAAILRDAADAAAWMRLMGQPVSLCILCEGDEALQARDKARQLLTPDPAVILLSADLADGQRETIEAASRLILYEGAGTVTAQLESMSVPVPAVPLPAPAPAPALEDEPLRFSNGLGGFQPGTDDYVIRLPQGESTPAPWCSLLTGPRFSTLCTESGLGASFAGGRHARLTCWSDDPVYASPAEIVYLRENNAIFTPTPLPLGQDMSCRIQYTPGVTVWRTLGRDLDMTLTAAVLPGTAFGCRTLRLKNMIQQARSLRMTIAVRFVMGTDEALCCLTPFEGGVAAHSPAMGQLGCISLAEGHGQSRAVSPAVFHGYGTVPDLDAPAYDAGTLALIDMDVSLPAGGSEAVTWVLGACRQMDDLERVLAQLRQMGSSVIYRSARQDWAARLNRLTVHTPDSGLDLLMNRILPWQVRSFRPEADCGRFRDRLLNMAALIYTEPDQVRAQLLTCARHQYTEGDVQHRWYSVQTGLRTHSMGDRLLLPFMTSWYIRRTGDRAILDEQLPWLLSEPLAADQEEICHTPLSTQEKDSLYTHCLRAMTSIQLGRRGLPLLHGGMDQIRGESVWLAMLFARTLHDFAEFAPEDDRAEMEQVRADMLASIERSGWDGSWYLRAFLEDGTPLGSAGSPECRIDSLSQSWAVLSLGVTERTAQAVDQAWQQLYVPRRGLLKQYAPPFDGKTDAGAMCGYLPGVSENGAQDTLTAAWMLWALCELGWADRAWMLAKALSPIRQGSDPQRYRLEPYILAGDVYVHPQQQGRGGRSGNNCGAAWLYAIILEKLLGFEKQDDRIRLLPMVPPDWDSLTITLQVGSATWHFHASQNENAVTCDGVPQKDGWILLTDDGRIHEVRTPLRQR